MSIIDLIILLCFLPAIYYGIKKGFIKQLAGIVALILGAWLAWKFTGILSNWISGWVEGGDTVIKIVSFTVIFIIVVVLVNLVGKLLEGIFRITLLSWANKLLGVIFSILKTALILSLIALILNQINGLIEIIPEDALAKSKLYEPISDLISVIFPKLINFFS